MRGLLAQLLHIPHFFLEDLWSGNLSEGDCLYAWLFTEIMQRTIHAKDGAEPTPKARRLMRMRRINQRRLEPVAPEVGGYIDDPFDRYIYNGGTVLGRSLIYLYTRDPEMRTALRSCREHDIKGVRWNAKGDLSRQRNRVKGLFKPGPKRETTAPIRYHWRHWQEWIAQR